MFSCIGILQPRSDEEVWRSYHGHYNKRGLYKTEKMAITTAENYLFNRISDLMKEGIWANEYHSYYDN